MFQNGSCWSGTRRARPTLSPAMGWRSQDAADAIVTGDLLGYQRRRLARGRTARRLGRLLLGLSRTERRAAWFLRELSGVVPVLMAHAVGGECATSRPEGADGTV